MASEPRGITTLDSDVSDVSDASAPTRPGASTADAEFPGAATGDPVEAPVAPTLRASIRTAWVPWLLSRIVVDVAMIASISHVWSNFELRYRGFVIFDFGWYHRIAVEGYGPAPTGGDEQTPWPFFPLYPGVLKLGRAAGFNDQIVGVLVNHVVLLLALAGLHRITARLAGADAARWAVWALACFPASFVFSMGYPSAIFLCASVWAFTFVDERRFAAAGWCAAVAALIRPNGFLVAATIGLGLVAQPWWPSWSRSDGDTTASRSTVQPTSRSTVRSTIRPLVLTVGPAAAGVATWLGYLWHRTGDPFVFIAAKGAWDEISIVEALTRAYAKFVGAHLALGVAALGVVAVAALTRRGLPWPWIVFTAAYLLPPFAVGLVGMGRYSNECFVPFVAAGIFMARWRRPVVIALLVCGSALSAVYAVQVVRYLWTP